MEKVGFAIMGFDSGLLPISVTKSKRKKKNINCQSCCAIIKVIHVLSPLFTSTCDKTPAEISCTTIFIILLKMYIKILYSQK